MVVRWHSWNRPVSKTHAFDHDEEKGFSLARVAAVCGTKVADREDLEAVVELPLRSRRGRLLAVPLGSRRAGREGDEEVKTASEGDRVRHPTWPGDWQIKRLWRPHPDEGLRADLVRTDEPDPDDPPDRYPSRRGSAQLADLEPIR